VGDANTAVGVCWCGVGVGGERLNVAAPPPLGVDTGAVWEAVGEGVREPPPPVSPPP